MFMLSFLTFFLFLQSTLCVSLADRKQNGRLDLIETKLELDKKYRREEFEMLFAKLTDIEWKLETIETSVANIHQSPISSDNKDHFEKVDHGISIYETLRVEHDRDVKVIQTAFQKEKEDTRRYRRQLSEYQTKIDAIVVNVEALGFKVSSISDLVHKSSKGVMAMTKTLDKCDDWKENMTTTVSALASRLNELLPSFNDIETILSVVNETRAVVHNSHTFQAQINDESKNENKTCRNNVYSSCKELLNSGHKSSGVVIINPSEIIGNIKVFCDQSTDGGGWTVFQRRQDGTVDFFRDWADYKSGFGDVDGEFWLGNDILSTMLAAGHSELRVDLVDFEGDSAYAVYSTFHIGEESSDYILHVSNYRGNAGDSLEYNNGMKFSTRDHDNDMWNSECSKTFKGGWWYKGCSHANLNGIYYYTNVPFPSDRLFWATWRVHSTSVMYKYVDMKFR